MNSSPAKNRVHVQALLGKLWRCERRGEFEAGLLSVSEKWADPEFAVDIDGLPLLLQLELQLRFASLLGYQGHFKKIPDSQLRARDLLSKVLREFEVLGDQAKCAECENHIALTYWRSGEYPEARTWLAASIQRPLASNNVHRLASYMYEMLVDVSEQRYPDIVERFYRHEIAFKSCEDDWITASFYVNAGIGFIEADQTDDALLCYELARYRAERSSIKTYLGSIENELAHVYKSLGRFAKAHRSVDRGIEVFRSLGDLSREGLLLDTKASIFLDERRFEDALITIETAIGLLKDGENKGYLAEAFLTEARILAWLDNFTGSIMALLEGVQIARKYSGENFAKSLIQHFEQTLQLKNSHATPGAPSRQNLEAGDLELVLPPEISKRGVYQGIWINNSHLEEIGIRSGDLVIAVDETVKRGDLAAITETETGEINCGFFDKDFGVVCIEGCDSQPQLFDENSVTIVGKIIGVVRGKDTQGRSIIEPIDLHRSLSEI